MEKKVHKPVVWNDDLKRLVEKILNEKAVNLLINTIDYRNKKPIKLD